MDCSGRGNGLPSEPQEERKKNLEFEKIKQKFLANRAKMIGKSSFKEFFDKEKMIGLPKRFVENEVIQRRMAEILNREFELKTSISKASPMPNARQCKSKAAVLESIHLSWSLVST